VNDFLIPRFRTKFRFHHLVDAKWAVDLYRWKNELLGTRARLRNTRTMRRARQRGTRRFRGRLLSGRLRGLRGLSVISVIKPRVSGSTSRGPVKQTFVSGSTRPLQKAGSIFKTHSLNSPSLPPSPLASHCSTFSDSEPLHNFELNIPHPARTGSHKRSTPFIPSSSIQLIVRPFEAGSSRRPAHPQSTGSQTT